MTKSGSGEASAAPGDYSGTSGMNEIPDFKQNPARTAHLPSFFGSAVELGCWVGTTRRRLHGHPARMGNAAQLTMKHRNSGAVTEGGRPTGVHRHPWGAPGSWPRGAEGFGKLLSILERDFARIRGWTGTGGSMGGTGANLSVRESPQGNRTPCRAGGMRQLFTAPSSSIFHGLSICPAPPFTHSAKPSRSSIPSPFPQQIFITLEKPFSLCGVTFPYLLPLLMPHQGQELPNSVTSWTF